MTTPRPPHASEILARFGVEIFGAEWAAPMARLTGTQERTLRRIRAAAADGLEYPAARGMLAALHEALAAKLVDLGPFAR